MAPSDGSDPDPAAFAVEVHPEREVVRVAPVGELDVATTPLLEAQLHELRRSGFDHVLLDLRGLTFIDSTGIDAIVAEDRYSRSTDRELSVLLGAAPIRRAFELRGLLEQLSIRSD